MLQAPARPVHVAAMQWAVLDHIADVRPIDDSDAACLNEIREVLEKHNALQRFGVSLLHRHFEVTQAVSSCFTRVLRMILRTHRGHSTDQMVGEPGGIRTHDQGIKSPVLCR